MNDSPFARKVLYWIRWGLVVPVFLLVWRAVSEIAWAPMTVSWEGHPFIGLFLATFILGFSPVLPSAWVAPAGKRLVGIIAALSSGPAPALLVLLFAYGKGAGRSENALTNSWIFSFGFVLGAASAVLCVAWILSRRHEGRSPASLPL